MSTSSRLFAISALGAALSFPASGAFADTSQELRNAIFPPVQDGDRMIRRDRPDPEQEMLVPGFREGIMGEGGTTIIEGDKLDPDNLGNHQATMTLLMNNHDIDGASLVNATRVRAVGNSAQINVALNAHGISQNYVAADHLLAGGTVVVQGQVFSSQYFYNSDRRLKQDIADVLPAEGMAMVRQISPVRYTLIASGAPAFGVIAQDLQGVMPSAVTANKDGMLSVDHMQMLSPIVASLQDLDARLAAIEAMLEGRDRFTEVRFEIP